jgi:hypothetical protein
VEKKKPVVGGPLCSRGRLAEIVSSPFNPFYLAPAAPR